MRNNKSNKGFTLIELLIVIAIIGILAAVLIPNLLSARDRARDTAAQACASNLVQQAEIYQIDKNTYAGFTGTAPYAPGTACSATNVAGWTITAGADANSVSGNVTSLGTNAQVFNWSNTAGIVRQ